MGPLTEFIRAQASHASEGKQDTNIFFDSRDGSVFSLIEDHTSWVQGNVPAGTAARDISPLRGSLVLFDSTSLPHEVLPTVSGTRVALAGWFHERVSDGV